MFARQSYVTSPPASFCLVGLSSRLSARRSPNRTLAGTHSCLLTSPQPWSKCRKRVVSGDSTCCSCVLHALMRSTHHLPCARGFMHNRSMRQARSALAKMISHRILLLSTQADVKLLPRRLECNSDFTPQVLLCGITA